MVVGLTASQQEIRASRVGASEAAAILGFDRWKTPHRIWLQKTGQAEPESMSAAAEWGLRKEQAIAQKYTEEHGVTLIEAGTLVHPTHDLVCATPDRIVLLPDARNCEREAWGHDLQMKAPHERMRGFWGEEGTDEIPDAYLVQVTLEMAVTGLPRADIAALFGQCDYGEWRVAYDEDLAGQIIEGVERWWRDHVVAKVEPQMTGEEMEARVIKRHPQDNGEVISPPPELLPVIEQYRDAYRAQKDAEKLCKALRADVIAALGATRGFMGEFGRLTYYTVNGKSKVDTDAVLREIVERYDVPGDVIASLMAKHTQPGKQSRAFKPTWAGIETSEEE